MKIVSDNIKNTLKEPTTQRKGKILVNGNYYEVFNVEYYADAYNEGNVIGNAIASQLDFDLPYIEKFDSFKYFDGVWTGNEYEYVDFGTFTVFDEKDQDEFNKHITAFDNLIKFNKAFEDKEDYPKTLFQELQNICSQAEVELENTSIVNGNFIVENNQFVAGENLKTVLKNICGISGTYAVIKNDKVVLQLKNITSEVINKSHHEPIDWKRKTYGINQVVLGLKDVGGEYVVKQDDEDIAQNGVHKLVINDNYFAYTQEKRQQLINELFEQVKGFGYIPYELKGEWLNYMDIGDTITIDDNETMILRISGKSPKSLESEMSAPAVIDSSIDYVDNTNTLANKQRRTELWVDKNVGEIRSEITKVETTVENITTTTQTSKGGNHLYLEDAMESNALEYIVEGKSEQDGTPTPDTPVEIKTVKGIRNLFDKDNANTLKVYVDNENKLAAGDTYFVYIQAESNKTYTVKKSNAGNQNRFFLATTETEPKIGTTINKKAGVQAGVNNSTELSITTDITDNYLLVMFWKSTESQITYEEMLNSIQIEEDSISHDLVPYGSWLKVKDTGKNYLKPINDYVWSNNGNATIEKIDNYMKINMPKSPYYYSGIYMKNYDNEKEQFASTVNELNGQECIYSFYAKADSERTIYFQCSDSEKIYITLTTEWQRYSKIIPNMATNQVPTFYCGTTLNTTSFYIKDIMLQKGSTATEYEPYKEQSTLIDMNIYDEEGNITGYYELSSINDIKDILTIQNKQATINQKMCKIVLDGSENWDSINTKVGIEFRLLNLSFKINSSNDNVPNIISDRFVATTPNMMWNNVLDGITIATTSARILISLSDTSITTTTSFKTWLSNNPVTVYYELAEPQTIELGDFPIMLYNNINNVTLMSDLETTTQITYLRNTPLSNDYATNQRVDKTDSDLETTNNSLNQTKQDVENTAVDLHNNYYDKEQIDSIITTTEEEITTLKQTVKTNTSSTNLQISVIEERLKNGVTSVKTETGYTFDKDGLTIAKTGSEMSSVLDNDGLSVKRNNTEVLTVRSAGVETENLKVRTYFTIGSHTRVEDYGNGTGFFHIGGV